MHLYTHLPEFPPDPIFGLAKAFQDDPRKEKYTFVTGYYQNEELKTPLFSVVAEVEEELARKRLQREYLPIGGDPLFIKEVGKLAFGTSWDEQKVVGIQSVGGTGALYLSGLLASTFTDQIYISQPTWVNHWSIYAAAGLETLGYPYYEKGELQFRRMKEELAKGEKGSAVLLHASGHNPSACDLSREEWEEIAQLLKKGGLFPIVDLAYQGLSTGVEEDALAIGILMKEKIDFAVTYTCAKNFSLYGERVGALFVVDHSGASHEKIKNFLCKQVRGVYSNPPKHGAAIVREILINPRRKEIWLGELAAMRIRIGKVRAQLAKAMPQKGPLILKGKGLFFYSELPAKGIEFLRKEKGLYLASDGRVNLTGLSDENRALFLEAFKEAEGLGR